MSRPETLRQAIAGFWVACERIAGDIPRCIELPARVFDKLLDEFPTGHLWETANSRGVDIVLTHETGQRVVIKRGPGPKPVPRPVVSEREDPPEGTQK